MSYQPSPADRPRIAYIISRFPKLSETFILREMVALEDRGWHIELFPFILLKEPKHQPEADRWLVRMSGPNSLSSIVRANIQWLGRSPAALLGLYLLVLFRLWRYPGEMVRGLIAVARAALWADQVADQHISHVHAHFALHPAVAALAVSRLTGVGFSFTGHSHDVYRHPALLAEKVHRAKFVAVVSRLLREQYVAPRVPPEDLIKVHVVRCGVQRGMYQWRAAQRLERVICLVTVARLLEVKGVGYLIEACRLLSGKGFDLYCRVVGDGPLRERLEQQIEDAGLSGRVVLLGVRTAAEVQQVLGWATSFVTPSIVTADGTMEGVPVSLMEAMASGVPVIATKTGAIPELVEDETTGLLVDPGDPRALAAAIERLHGDVELASRLAAAARRRVEDEYDLERNVAVLDGLFQRAMGSVETDDVKVGAGKRASLVR